MFTSLEIQSYLKGRWSQPLRAACPHLSTQARQLVIRKTRTPIPRWVEHQYFLRWLGEACAARAAWQAKQPGAPRYYFGRRSEPNWSQTVTLAYDPRPWRHLPEDDLLLCMSLYIERLYRITQTPQWEIGEDLWTQTFLGACQHLAQLYAALARRCKAARARRLTQALLTFFVTWHIDDGRTTLPAPGAPPAGWETSGTPAAPAAMLPQPALVSP